MAGDIKLNVSFHGDEELKRNLKAMGDRAEKVLRPATLSGGEIIVTTAKPKCRKKTGNLRRSIHAEVVSASATRVVVKAGTDVVYAAPHEFGTDYITAQPYMRPALDEKRNEVKNEICDAIRTILKGGLL